MSERVKNYVGHAASALDDASYLLEDNRLLALANRSYYAIFYCVSALLETKNITTKQHSGARAKFSELFVKTGLFSVEASKIVGNSFAARQSADYDMESFISEQEAQLLLSDAREFYRLTVAYLTTHTATE
ncbi:MAG: HEPN domain-containing protein [Cytophagales bacterium]|nr:MAG: HEPN domain-containing protein [Cytophagales bacterium]